MSSARSRAVRLAAYTLRSVGESGGTNSVLTTHVSPLTNNGKEEKRNMKHIQKLSVMKAQGLPESCTDLVNEFSLEGLKACVKELLGLEGDGGTA